MRFPRSAPPTARERDAVAAFGDALAAALHDAATHHELRLVTARSSYEAVHDPLTGLANRAAMLSKGDQSLRQLSHDHPVALLLLDINHFKEVNDTLGHAAGDQLLRLTANRLDALVRAGELLGRLGGDEFALLLTAVPVLGDRAARRWPHALRQAREIAERLAAPTEVAGVRMSIEVSVGVVVAAAGTADLTELLRRADIAMYQAKEGGGNVAAYDAARDAASTDQLALLAELREALKVDDQLVLALQPAVDLATGAPTGVEALIRWQHPRRGLAEPGRLHPAGGEQRAARHLHPVRAGQGARRGRRAGPGRGSDVPISVNLSARSLLDPRLPAEVADALRRHQVPPHRLVLEITETVVMSELEVIDEVLGDAPGDGRAARGRRLRHRLLVADLPDPDRGGRAEGRPVLRHADGRLAGGRRDRPDDRRPRLTSWGCGWSPKGWRPPSSGWPWPSWAAPPRRATTSSSRCRPTRSSRCCGRCATRRESNVFRLRADGAS